MTTIYIVDRTTAVIQSCTTPEQLESAERYCDLMAKHLFTIKPYKSVAISYGRFVGRLLTEQLQSIWRMS